MVEFNFNISSLFPEEVSIITNDLIPVGYSGDDNYAVLKKKVCIKKVFACILFKFMSYTQLTVARKTLLAKVSVAGIMQV